MKKSVVIQEPKTNNVKNTNNNSNSNQGKAVESVITQALLSNTGEKQIVESQIKKDEKIKVAIRVRPKLKQESHRDSVIECNLLDNKIRVSDLTHIVESKYDQLFDGPQNQKDVYEFITSTIKGVFDGYNSTIFAYGQTGSENNQMLQKQGTNQLIRMGSQLIEIKKELYQGQEDQNDGIFVEGLSEYIVQTEKDCFALLRRGELNRITRQTKKNILSSRSHSIFQLLIESDKPDARGFLKKAKLNLCDLAGSEKIHGLEDVQNALHMNELKTINLSLTNLGKVIQSLSKESKMQRKQKNLFTPRGHQNDYFQKVHIPYRDSQLTRILQDSLGGNTRTVLIATVSPIIDNIEETISTLKFADRAKQVMAVVKVNEINAQDDALVQKLQKEVQTLREVLNLRRKGMSNDIQKELLILKEENLKLKEMAQNADMVEKLKLENKLMKLELQKIKDVGSSDYGSTTQYQNTLGSTDLSNGGIGGLGNNSSFVRKSYQSDPFMEFQESDPTQSSPSSNNQQNNQAQQNYSNHSRKNSQTQQILSQIQKPKQLGGALILQHQQQQINPKELIVEERKQEVKSLQGTLQKSGRCPICTLMPPCNHYKDQNEILRQNINEVNEHLEETFTGGQGNKNSDDLVLPKLMLGKNQPHAQSLPSLNLEAVRKAQAEKYSGQSINKRYEDSNSKKDLISGDEQSLTIRKNSNSSSFQMTFNNPNRDSDSSQKRSDPSFFPQLVAGLSNNQNLQDYGSDHFTSISQRFEKSQLHSSFKKKASVGYLHSSNLLGIQNGMAPQTERQELIDESSFLEVRIRGKNNTFAKKKASAFVTLDEQLKIQQMRKQQIRQSERLKQLQIFERDRETKIKNDFQEELKKIEDQFSINALQSARKKQ
eukprot:403331039